MSWSVYVVRCADGTFYTGIAIDVARRVREHNRGARGARYTRSRRPVILVWSVEVGDRSAALRAEAAVKRLSRREKEAIVVGRRSLFAVQT